MNRNGIAIAGNLILDEIKYIENYPAPNTLTTITGTARSPGGLVCNCVSDLARMDPCLPLHAVGVVGRDSDGDFLLSALGRFPSVDLWGIRRRGQTSRTDVMTLPDGSRTFFQYRGANALLRASDFDFTKIRADILHIGYLLLLDALDGPDPDYPTAMCRVLAAAGQAGLRTSIDVVSENGDRYGQIVPPALAYTDYCIINELEAQRITGLPLRGASGDLLGRNLPSACKALHHMGVRRWAVIHAPKLACAMDADGVFVRQPSRRLPRGFIVSSVGAGDAFASGVLYGAYHGWDLERTLHTAIAVAGCSLSGEGASDAIIPLDDLLQKMNTLR